MPPTGTEWVERLASALGVPAPTPEEAEALLGLAAVAAHASERTAAPLSTWLAGRAVTSPEEVRAAALRLASELEAEGGPLAGRST